MPNYRHIQTCQKCGRENKGQVSPKSEPWIVGIAWCPYCRMLFNWNVYDNADRVVPIPEQLTLFPMGNGKTKG